MLPLPPRWTSGSYPCGEERGKTRKRAVTKKTHQAQKYFWGLIKLIDSINLSINLINYHESHSKPIHQGE